MINKKNTVIQTLVILVLSLACASSAIVTTPGIPVVEKLHPVSPTKAVIADVRASVCAEILNVRRDHNTSAEVIRNLSRADVVIVREWMSDGWAEIGEGQGKEYINADWLCK